MQSEKQIAAAQGVLGRGGVYVGAELIRAALEAALSGMEPVAARYDFDGCGFQYIDNGSGSDWKTRHPDAEMLYAAPPAPSVAVKAIEYTEAIGEAAQGYFNSFEHVRIHTPGTFRFEKLWDVMQSAALSAQVQDVAGWQSMDTAPKDGKHCLLAVKAGPFVYAVQGAYSMGEWGNAADIHSEPLCWMPLTRIPPVYLPWTAEFSAAAPAKQEASHVTSQ